MNNINENVNLIRGFLKNQKDSTYPIKNHLIEKADDYLKDLYIKMLCVIKEYDENTCEEQILFINRILKGCNIKQTINEYTKQALTIDESFVKEFILQFKENNLKYNFFVDALILASINKIISKNVIAFICEISEMILLNKEEIQFLTDITLSIVEQNNERYKKINKKLDYIDIMWFWCYLKEYVYGCIENSENKLWYYSKEKRQVEIKNICKLYEELDLLHDLRSNKKVMPINAIKNRIEEEINKAKSEGEYCDRYVNIFNKLNNIYYKSGNIDINIENLDEIIYGNEKDNNIEPVMQIKNDNVIFENLIINLTNVNLHFKNNENIIFKNCKFIGGKNRIKIDACKNLIIYGCKFEMFSEGIFYIRFIENFIIKDSCFNECKKSSQLYGIIYIEDKFNVSISSCQFKGCTSLGNIGFGRDLGILFFGENKHGIVKVDNCKFINCKGLKEEGHLFYCETLKHQDCEFIGCDPLNK